MNNPYSRFAQALEPDPESREPWMDTALCAQTNPEVFFPKEGGSTRDAKKVCARCDVTVDAAQLLSLGAPCGRHRRRGPCRAYDYATDEMVGPSPLLALIPFGIGVLAELGALMLWGQQRQQQP